MANTDVILINDEGVYVPSADSIPVVSGDTISFTTSDGKPVVAFFSLDAASVLSPAPGTTFSIGNGVPAKFSFTSSRPGAYWVYFGIDASAPPTSSPSGISQSLLLRINTSDSPPFDNPMISGH